MPRLSRLLPPHAAAAADVSMPFLLMICRLFRYALLIILAPVSDADDSHYDMPMPPFRDDIYILFIIYAIAVIVTPSS